MSVDKSPIPIGHHLGHLGIEIWTGNRLKLTAPQSKHNSQSLQGQDLRSSPSSDVLG